LTQIQLRNDQHQEVGVGEVGELFSRSPYLFNGYWNQPEATGETFQDGWVSVGDLAVRDDEGFYYIVDRKKDVIISGGVNVYPREIEEILFRHPSVADAAVVGIEDSYWGESAKAFIVQKPGSSLTQEDLDHHCRASLAGFKIPKTYQWIETLPRNAAGKVLKQELKQLMKEEL
jgi:long-chain acyl-CoA synthetase